MVTKAIITEVIPTKVSAGGANTTNTTIMQYRIRIPLLHLMPNDSQCTPDSELPIAIACTFPGMTNMVYHKYDVVFVAIEDLDLSLPIILGFVPNMQQNPYRGANATSSQTSIENMLTLTVSKDGNVELPYDTKIYMDVNNNPIHYKTSGETFINGNELGMLKGVNLPIQEQLDRTAKSMGAFGNIFNLTPYISSNKGVAKLVVDSNKWVSNSSLLETDVPYVFKHVANISTVPVWQLEYSGIVYSYTRETLAQIGIEYTSAQVGASFTIIVTSSPMSIEHGGTGADNAKDAIENLGSYQMRVVPLETFQEMEQGESLPSNTVFFIYDDEVEKEDI